MSWPMRCCNCKNDSTVEALPVVDGDAEVAQLCGDAALCDLWSHVLS